MRLYLDLCIYNRPFDNQAQSKIALETNAFVYVLEKVENGIHSLVVSDTLRYENSKNPYGHRKIRINSYFSLAKESIRHSQTDLDRARFLERMGFSGFDALHIALAERAEVDYFITCDDEIIDLYNESKDLIKVKVVDIIEFSGM